MAVPPGGTGVSATRGRHDDAGSIGDDDGPAGGHLVANAHLPEVRAGRGDVPRGDLDTATITTDHRAVVGAGPDTVERNGEHGAGVAVASRGDQHVTALVTGRREEDACGDRLVGRVVRRHHGDEMDGSIARERGRKDTGSSKQHQGSDVCPRWCPVPGDSGHHVSGHRGHLVMGWCPWIGLGTRWMRW